MPAGRMLKAKSSKRSRPIRRSRFPLSKRQVKAVKKIAQGQKEIKEVTQDYTDSSVVAANANVVALNTLYDNIAQGTDDDERIGDKIYIKDLSVNMTLNSGTANGNIRILAYQMLDDELDTAGLASFFTDINGYWPDFQTTNSKYKILMDKRLVLNAASQPNKSIQFRFPAKRLPVKQIQYDDATTTFNSRGLVRIHVLTDNATASQMTYAASARLRYTD